MTRPDRAALGRPPALLVVPAALAVLFLLVPLAGLVAESPWRRLPDLLTRPEVGEALVLSLGVAAAAAGLSLVLGLPLAWVLARVDLPGRGALRALVTIPLVLPPVVAGVALLAALGRNGLVGGPLHAATGVTIPFTTAAVVIAHTFIAMPFFVISAEGALRASGREYDVVAATLGATRWRTFRTVTLPMVLPGIAAGLLLAWARSLGEFGATITFAGNYPGVTRTMPLLVYGELQRDPRAAYGLSLVLLVLSVAVLALLRERWLGALR
ncbi:MAG TPA: ABC transporter permease [Marmoricola sp.]|nr:ABC transporter permease [Marmoricola sp.]